METHVFNEQKKRLEPIENVCMFCGRGCSESQEDNLYLPIYKEDDRLNIVVYRRVSYKKIDVGVARCPHCKEIHRKQKIKTLLLAVGIGVLATIMIEYFIGFIVISAMIGFAIGFVAWAFARVFVERKNSIKENILTKEDAAQQYELVRGLLADGWTFDKPTA